MKFQRLQYPGKTLIVSTLDKRYGVFVLYFLKLWQEKFMGTTDFWQSSDLLALDVSIRVNVVAFPTTFVRCWWYLIRARYRTVVFLNPDHKADRKYRWAARLAFTKHRAGFAPLKNFEPVNYSLPFNAENHHYVHQLKLFFEYLTGEKVQAWRTPEAAPVKIPANAQHLPTGEYGVLCIDIADQSNEFMLPNLIKFVNLITRHFSCVLLFESSEKDIYDSQLQNTARNFSEVMTERAMAACVALLNPPDALRSYTLSRARWVLGSSAQTLGEAALRGVPSISIFGPLNERVWQPFSTRARTITGEFSCRPCTPHPGHVVCTSTKPWQCIGGVSGELMAATVTGMLRKRATSGSAS